MKELKKNYHYLLVEDELAFCQKMNMAFRRHYTFDWAKNEEEAKAKVQKNKYDFIMLDLDLFGDRNFKRGIEFIPVLKAKAGNVPIIVATKDEKVKTAVQALKAGATHYFFKGEYDKVFWDQQFRLTIEAASIEKLKAKERKLKHLVANMKDQKTGQHAFISKAAKIESLKKQLIKLSEFPNVTLLLAGETGVGKEVAARFLHDYGARKNKPFVAVNLSAIQESVLESTLFGHKKGSFTGAIDDHIGYFEQANGGVLFLDEIGEISLEMQVKLLRFLEDKIIRPIGGTKDIQLDVQILTATNRNLEEEVKKGTFREDFYHRLKNYVIEIPPLRERREDILPLLNHFAKQNIEDSIDAITFERLQTYNWPGNVRELRNTVESMLLKATILEKEKVDLDCLPVELQNFDPIAQKLAALKNQPSPEPDLLVYKVAQQELQEVENALIATNGRKAEAAEKLGMNDQNLRYLVLKKHYVKHPELFEYFPTIRKAYKLD